MLVAEKPIGLSWVSARDRLPFDGHECALICRHPNSNDLKRKIGCRLHEEWKIEDHALVNWDVRAWLRLPSIRRSEASVRGAGRIQVAVLGESPFC